MSTDRIVLAHGGGGQLMAELIAQVILPALGGPAPGPLYDAARCAPAGRGCCSPPTATSCCRWSSPAATSASWPSAARSTTWPSAGPGPVALSMALVLEEGLEIDLLRRVLASAAEAAGRRRGHRHRRHQGRRAPRANRG